MEKRKFEEEWREAFDQAEASPSDNLWTNIELNLEKAESEKMKSRLLFYKLTAAASIIFAMCVAGAGLYYFNERNSHVGIALTPQMPDVSGNAEQKIMTPIEEKVTMSREPRSELNAGENETHRKSQPKKSSSLSPALASSTSVSASQIDKTSSGRHVLNKNQEELNNKIPATRVGNSMLTDTYGKNINTANDLPAVSQNEPSIQRKLNERRLLPLTVPVRSTLTFAEQDPVAIMMAKLEQREKELAGADSKEISKKPASRDERLWTSVGFAAGTFNTVNQNIPQAAMVSTFTSNNVTSNQSKASGTSYSVGMNMGTKLSERWVLQGGVNYLAQNSSYEANSVVGSADFMSYQAASINSLSSKNTQSQGSKLVATVPYSVDNSVRFLSVPIQAGYMMVNHALGLQLNGGVSTDVFLQNKLSPQSNSLPIVTQGSGEDSPYRTVNFSGLLGTEISYRFSKHYRLALNPGIRYPFNSIYKSEVGIKATPLTFDVGMRFRYIFH